MVRDGTLGSMMQGVSQQPATVRPEGKVTEQINMVSDFVTGLSNRPALERVSSLNGASGASGWKNIELSGTKYLITHRLGALLAWTLDGVSVPVVQQDAASLAYVGPDMAGYVYDDVYYLTNRNTVVARGTALGTAAVVMNYALVYCLGGKFSRTYVLNLRYADGTVAVGTFTTPDGLGVGDGAKTDSQYIATQLRTTLIAHASYKVGTTTTRVENTLYIAYSGPVTVTATDGEQNISLRSHGTTVTSLENLSRYAPHGAYVRVTGNDEGTEDDTFMRFKSDITSTLGSGFGSPGVWEEWTDVAQSAVYNDATMPHALFESGGSLYFERNVWVPRRVGDDETNPFPAFVGRSIRDISGMDGRLVMVSGPNVHMSRVNTPGDFFKKTTLGELPTDPIEAHSTREGKVSLDWIVQFDRDLVLVSNDAKGQYIITGGSALTPGNVSVPLTTAFEVSGFAKPVRTGKTILLPFMSGKFSGMNEFVANDTVVSNGVDVLTSTVDRYITGKIKLMECSTNFNTVLLSTDGVGEANTVWVYKFLWEGNDRAQSSWGRWELPGQVEHMFFDGGLVYFALLLGGYYCLLRLDLDRPEHPDTGYNICLDNQMSSVASSLSTVTLSSPGLSFVQGAGCESIGRGCTPLSEVAVIAGVSYRYTFDPLVVPPGSTVIAGVPFMRSVTPTMPYPRDRNGNLISKYDLTVSNFSIQVENTGSLSTTMTGPYRPDLTLDFDWFPLDDDPLDPDAVGIRDAVLDIPWGERTAWSELTVHSDDVRPTTILSIQWTGEYES